MDIQELRQSLKMKWLSYYKQNRSWLVKMRVWATYDGLRRPSSGFILATLSVLEPELEQMLAFIMELNNDPDRIINALGLHFHPDVELGLTPSSLNLEQEQTQREPNPFKGFAAKNTFRTHRLHNQPVLSLVQKSEESLPGNHKLIHTHQAVAGMRASGNHTTSEINVVSSNGHNQYSNRNISQQAQPLPSVRLALVKETPPNGKTVRILEITTKVPGQPKTLTSPLKVNPSPSTNASSLPSWVDEFCQGTGWN